MFFAKPGVFAACGLYNLNHLLSVVVIFILLIIAIKKTKIEKKEDISRIIKISTITVWILEIIKIIFNFIIGNISNVNTYVPLYFCSLLLYAGIFSSFFKGTIKRVGDVFLATGGLIAGIAYLISPGTSLGIYPIFHFISFQSLFYHAVMIYLGIIIIKYDYIKINYNDIKYYAILIFIICFLAGIVNTLFNGNLMFIKNGFGFFSLIEKYCGNLYPLIMVIGQMTVPFYLGLFLNKIIKKSV